jgi:hypothetical protein
MIASVYSLQDTKYNLQLHQGHHQYYAHIRRLVQLRHPQRIGFSARSKQRQQQALQTTRPHLRSGETTSNIQFSSSTKRRKTPAKANFDHWMPRHRQKYFWDVTSVRTGYIEMH